MVFFEVSILDVRRFVYCFVGVMIIKRLGLSLSGGGCVYLVEMWGVI